MTAGGPARGPATRGRDAAPRPAPDPSVRSPRPIGRWNAAAAARLAGILVSFTVAVDLFRSFRPALLLDADPSWAPARLLLGVALVAGTAAAGAIAAGILARAGEARALSSSAPLPIRRSVLAGVAAAALVAGAAARFVALDRIPSPVWIDDVSLVGPTLALEGTWRDFSDSVRPAPFGVKKIYGTVGVLYLEAQRLALGFFGATVFGIRFLGAAAGVASLVTAFLLGRALLPRGGGALALLALAGMRWHLILSRWGWVAVVLAPILDAAALLLLRARRKRSAALALAAGAVAGIGAHVYLAAWVAGAALVLLALWRAKPLSQPRIRLRLAAGVVVGFAAAAAPLFLFARDRPAPYFTRASDHSLLLEIRRTRGPLPAFSAAADSLAAPWLLPDPTAANDLPGRSRLGWLLGIPVAAALARALVRPGREASAYLLSSGAAAFAASVAGGQAGLPNGFRFAYLAPVAAVAAADGALWLVALVPRDRRRLAAITAVGLLAISGFAGARDAVLRWGESRTTFDYFYGQDTLIARAALRWERFGSVAVAGTVGYSPKHSPLTISAVRRHRLDPDVPRLDAVFGGAVRGRRAFRIVPAAERPRAGERVVERIRDGWDREWGVVLGVVDRPPFAAVSQPRRPHSLRRPTA